MEQCAMRMLLAAKKCCSRFQVACTSDGKVSRFGGDRNASGAEAKILAARARRLILSRLGARALAEAGRKVAPPRHLC